tara:strand:+ start:148 stop:264 length:117 start_codon:yes stop_codon:yes gene_type:complete
MSNVAITTITCMAFFLLGDIFGVEGIVEASKQIISHFQ